jgi:hypothetical protein
MRIAAVPKVVRTVECVELTSSDDDDDDVNNVSRDRNDEDECMIVDEPSSRLPVNRTAMPGAAPMPPPPPTRLDSDTDDDEVEALSDNEDTDDVRAIKRRRRDECTCMHRVCVVHVQCWLQLPKRHIHRVFA